VNKNRIYNKLVTYRSDLTDDSIGIYAMNRDIDDLITCFQKGVKSDNVGNITEKIDNLKEKSQQSDADISNARSCIQYEMDAVQREIEQEEAARKAAAAAAIAALKANIIGKI
jgi:hypothetical protein